VSARVRLATLLLALTATENNAAAENRLGANLEPVTYWSHEYKFLDLMKHSGPWGVKRARGVNGPGDPGAFRTGEVVRLTPSGWPLEVPEQRLVCTLLLRDSAGHWPHLDGTTASRWRIDWQGRGEFRLELSEATVRPAAISMGYTAVRSDPASVRYDPDPSTRGPTGGSAEFDIVPSKGGVDLCLISISPEDPIHRVRFLPPEYADRDTDADPGSVFWPHFVEEIRRYSGPLRMLGPSRGNESPVHRWSERPKLRDARQSTERGIALEYQIMMANLSGNDLWLTLPYNADDDFVRRAAALVSAQLNPPLQVIPEYSNEVWNQRFPSFRHAVVNGSQLGLCGDARPNSDVCGHHFYAWRSNQIQDFFEQALGSERVVRFYGTQASNSWVTDRILEFDGAGERAEAVGTAPYFCGGIRLGRHPLARCPPWSPHCARKRVQGWPDDDANGVADWKQIPVPSVEQLIRHCGRELETALFDLRKGARQHCHHIRENWPAAQCWAYESGQHLLADYPHLKADPRWWRRLVESQTHPAWRDLYLRYHRALFEAGYQVVAVFSSVSKWDRHGSWGLREFDDGSRATYPKYDAVRLMLEELRAYPKTI